MIRLTEREQTILDLLKAGERDLRRLGNAIGASPTQTAVVVRRLVSFGAWKGAILELGGGKVAVNV